MKIFFIIVFLFLFIALIAVVVMLLRQSKNENKAKTIEKAKAILDEHEFVLKRLYVASDDLVVAINKKEDKLAFVEIGDIYDKTKIRYYTISANLITQIEKTPLGINITYINNGNKDILTVPNKNKEIEELIHDVYKNAIARKLASKYSINSFQYSASSDWACEYVWAFKTLQTVFAYYKTTDKKAIYKLNILKEFFTIDVKLNYFEAPVLGIPQQLSTYENSFLNDIFLSLLKVIKQKCNVIADNRIYFDSYNEIAYLTNGITTLQSIVFKNIEEVYYKQDKLSFTLKNSDRIINFPADRYMTEKFEDFITNYNLAKIAKSFDYTTDKLINTTESTKFIIDSTRNRVVYCAGLTNLAKFNYMTIMYNNLENATVEKSKESYFVRIYTKDKDIIDVSCNKHSVAQYILAQIMTIINL